MPGFLDADCVISALFAKGVFTRKLWKLERVEAHSYYVSFEFAGSARAAGFMVSVLGGIHCIGITALLNQSRRFMVPVDDILLRCALP
jgi:hypothetical protein